MTHERSRNRRRLWTASAVVLAATVLVSLDTRWGESRTDPAARQPADLLRPLRPEVPSVTVGSSVRRDTQGRIVEASAPDPRQALEAFAREVPGDAALLDVRPSPGEWTGVLRDGAGRQPLAARPDPDGGGWVARRAAPTVARRLFELDR